MTHQQIRELQSAIEEVDLHRDFIAKLPLEIAHIILQYLPIHQAFQARRVSSKWRQILSSAQTVELLLRDWFPKGGDGLGLRIPEGVSSKSLASLKAEHVDAYRTGHAFTYASHEWDARGPRLATYAEGIMAWVDGNHSNLIRSIDLKTGNEGLLTLENGTNIDAIAMSSSMVVAVSSEDCHVWTSTRGESHRLRFPASVPGHIMVSVSRESLAIAYSINPMVGEQGFKVLTWTLKDQKLCRFFVATPEKSYTWSIMLDSNGETLLFFFISLSRRGASMQFHYTRTNLDGDVLAQGVTETPRLERDRQFFNSAVPKEVNGRAVIWAYAMSPQGVHDFSGLILIYYNFQEHRLEYRAHTINGLNQNSNTRSQLFCWKDTAYYLEDEDERCRFKVIDLRASTCREAMMTIPISTSNLRLREDGRHEPLLFGDETFFITTFSPGFGVWCFDKNVQLHNENTSYKEKRTNNINQRLNSKRERYPFNPELYARTEEWSSSSTGRAEFRLCLT